MTLRVVREFRAARKALLAYEEEHPGAITADALRSDAELEDQANVLRRQLLNERVRIFLLDNADTIGGALEGWAFMRGLTQRDREDMMRHMMHLEQVFIEEAF